MGCVEMEIAINSEQKAMVETAGKFARKVKRPEGIELDKLDAKRVVQKDSVLWSVYRKYHELGFHKLMIPKFLGELEVDPLTWTMIVE